MPGPVVAFGVRWLPFSLLAGCPYIWERPVDPTAVDTADTGPVLPRIEGLEVEPEIDHVRFDLLAMDPDSDLVRFGVVGAPRPFERDLSGLERLERVFSVPWPLDCAPVDAEVSVWVEDAEGHRAERSVRVTRAHAEVSGDGPRLPASTTVCGDVGPDETDCFRVEPSSAPYILEVRGPAHRVTLTVGDRTDRLAVPLELRLPGDTGPTVCIRGEGPWQAGVFP